MLNQFMKKNKIKTYYWKGLDIIPDLSAIAREMTEKSQIQIVLNKILRLNFFNKILFSLSNILYTFDILKKDFACGIKVLTELELLSKKKKKKVYFFHFQIVDTAVAFKNKKLIVNLIKLSKIYSFYPVFITHNLKSFLIFCKYSDIDIKSIAVAFPLNLDRYLMNPMSISETEKLINYSKIMAFPILDLKKKNDLAKRFINIYGVIKK